MMTGKDRTEKRGIKMSNIELVIKIPEEDFERCKKRFQMRIDIMGDAIANGTPLPKGHGDLIDRKDLDITTITTDDYSGNEVIDVVLKEDVDGASAIIEADKGEE